MPQQPVPEYCVDSPFLFDHINTHKDHAVDAKRYRTVLQHKNYGGAVLRMMRMSPFVIGASTHRPNSDTKATGLLKNQHTLRNLGLLSLVAIGLQAGLPGDGEEIIYVKTLTLPRLALNFAESVTFEER